MDAIGNALTAIGADHDAARNQKALSKAVDAALQAAVSLGRKKRGVSFTSRGEASLVEIIAENVRSLRLEAGWTQERLANAMTAIGFTWSRETMVEVERTGRKMQLEEVVGIAALFGVPISDLLLPDDDTVLDLREARIDREHLRELILGRGGKTGQGGPDWIAAVSVLGTRKTVERPAADLWQARRESRELER